MSLNKRFGNRVAVLAGDILYTHFFSLITGLPSVPAEDRFSILNLFLETTKAMCIGEILAQEAVASPLPYTFQEYVEISSDKTASLFAACCESAGILVGAGKERMRSLRDFGLSFGLTFQMVDDLIDRDHGLDDSVDLHAQALAWAEKARGTARLFSEGESRERFVRLVDYVIGQAIA